MHRRFDGYVANQIKVLNLHSQFEFGGNSMEKVQKKNAVRLFLSYSWKDSDLANSIDYELCTLGFDVKRDIRDIGPWKSIREFMSLIKNQDYAVMLISSSYLKSPNCMYEVMEVLSNSEYRNRILSIVTPDADIYNPISRAGYIGYWEEETKKLEGAIKPLKLENTTELTAELRKYKSIEIGISSFLDIVSDKNNPRIVDAVEKIKLVVCSNGVSESKDDRVNLADCIAIEIEAFHYAFLKFAALEDVTGTQLEKMIGIKRLDEETKRDAYDLPMLRCRIRNCSQQTRMIQEPILEGAIEINGEPVDAIGFGIKSEAEKTLEPNATTEFVLHGRVIEGVVKAFLENCINSLYVEDSFGFRYYALTKQLEEVAEYFRKYCSDLVDLKSRHDKYCL